MSYQGIQEVYFVEAPTSAMSDSIWPEANWSEHEGQNPGLAVLKDTTTGYVYLYARDSIGKWYVLGKTP